ncbi:hypothetical protein BAE44_0011514 [Dichanthelium oligosanthes]|uniref:DUF1618 domain-containing protein n=1 Tax=Dichanthelium oligosanthes TaxID=888268 RepID=A0A1E5VQT4_9POAL|nr:hypothetical protein BAE44_0011514 [Dichanthelium oligosanthes]
MAVRLPLPPELRGPTFFFHVDMAFAFAGSHVFWVDLLTGVLVCDLFEPQGPESPVARGVLPVYPPTHNIRFGLKPQEFRSMGCACGAIKLVAMTGYSEGLPSNEVALKTWTLSPDLKEWKKGSAIQVGDLWGSKSFSAMGLPRVRPMFPVLSMDEDGIIYVFLNEIEYVDEVNDFGQIIGRQLVLKGHHVICLDLPSNNVLYS